MAFSEEQEAQILEMMGKMGEFLSNNNNGKEKDESLLEEAKKNVENSSKQSEVQATMEKALGFNMTISNFAEKYKDVMPSNVKSIIDTANGKTYTSAVAKADEMRKAIIEAYLEVQANIENLPESMKAKANSFKALSEDAKKEKSGLFWEIVEVGAEMQMAKARASALQKANGSGIGGEENAFRQKFLSLGDKYKRKD